VTPAETQPQRTALSWQRTGFGLLGVAALLGHVAVREGRVLPAGAAAVVALAGLAVLAGVAPRRARQLARRPAAAPRAGALATAAVVVAALAAAVVLLSR
jgi:putative membrane protein